MKEELMKLRDENRRMGTAFKKEKNSKRLIRLGALMAMIFCMVSSVSLSGS